MSTDATIAAVGDPTRRELIRRLARGPLRASELARGFSISRPAICKHTRLLTRAGLIRVRKTGRERIYQLAPGGGKALRSLIDELETVSRFWDAALDSFKRFTEENR